MSYQNVLNERWIAIGILCPFGAAFITLLVWIVSCQLYSCAILPNVFQTQGTQENMYRCLFAGSRIDVRYSHQRSQWWAQLLLYWLFLRNLHSWRHKKLLVPHSRSWQRRFAWEVGSYWGVNLHKLRTLRWHSRITAFICFPCANPIIFCKYHLYSRGRKGDGGRKTFVGGTACSHVYINTV